MGTSRLSRMQLVGLQMIEDENDRFIARGGGVAGPTLRSLFVRGLVREVSFEGCIGLTQAGHAALRDDENEVA